MKLIIITGQTATGKTKLAQDYAQKHNGELVNADSRQIYKYLDIITGKDIATVHLYDIVSPKDYFSSFDYKVSAKKVIEELQKRKKIPIIVGGTYLYLKHLLYTIDTERILPDWDLRKKLSKTSTSQLQKLLKTIDPNLFNSLNNSDKNNPQRLIRKIEIASSKKKEVQNNNAAFIDQFSKKDLLFIGLRYDSKLALRDAIQKRVNKRLEQGAIPEVKKLLEKGYTESDPGLKTIGYQQVIKYIKGKYSIEDMKQEWITKEMQYAKRQYTFMKKDKHIEWRTI